MKRAGKGGKASHREVVRPEATEDVTLSGAPMGRDCTPIALRRSPLTWVPKVKAGAVFSSS